LVKTACQFWHIGPVEILLGRFFASSLAHLFGALPQAIVGAMMLLVGIELVKFAQDVRWGRDLVPMALTVAVSILTNMAFGFLAGLASHYLVLLFGRKRSQS
jgi:MFS superfamily sulfate permease-like transporter